MVKLEFFSLFEDLEVFEKCGPLKRHRAIQPINSKKFIDS